MLITNARVITFDEPNAILDDVALQIDDGLITEIGPSVTLTERHPDEQRLDAGGQYVLPGLINTHSHFYSSFVRGLAVPGAQPFALPTILERLWFPFDRALREEDVRYSVYAAVVDAIRHGVTTIFDHHSSPEAADGILDTIAEVVDEAGLRSVLCFEVTDRNGPDLADAGIAENARFLSRCAAGTVAGGRVRANFGIHAPMTVSDATLARCRESAPADAGFHVHVGEHEYDQVRSLEQANARSVDRLAAHDLLGPRTICAHAIHLDAREIMLLSEHGARVSHQPRNNMNVGDGLAAIESLLRAGVPVSIGNDGMSQTPWRDWEYAMIVPRGVHRDARRMPPDAVVEMGVRHAAALAGAYFPEAPIGVLVPGAVADLILVDYHPTTPLTVENLAGHLLFGVSESQVTATIVAGKVLMRDRQLTGLDEERVAARCRELVPDLWRRYEQLVPRTPILG